MAKTQPMTICSSVAPSTWPIRIRRSTGRRFRCKVSTCATRSSTRCWTRASRRVPYSKPKQSICTWGWWTPWTHSVPVTHRKPPSTWRMCSRPTLPCITLNLDSVTRECCMLMLNLWEESKINSEFSHMCVQNGTKTLRLVTSVAMKPVASAMVPKIRIASCAETVYHSLQMVSATPIAHHMHLTTWPMSLSSKRRSGMHHTASMTAPSVIIQIRSLSSAFHATWIVRRAIVRRSDLARRASP